MKLEWRHDLEFTLSWKRQPAVAEKRLREAAAWRVARRHNAAVTRLLWKRLRAAEKEAIERVWNESSSTKVAQQGLSKLLNP